LNANKTKEEDLNQKYANAKAGAAAGTTTVGVGAGAAIGGAVGGIPGAIVGGLIGGGIGLIGGLLGFDSGGYTGQWTDKGSTNNGKLAILHEKELVLNAEDTKNILAAVDTVRFISDSLRG
jgi:hypothetical protein